MKARKYISIFSVGLLLLVVFTGLAGGCTQEAAAPTTTTPTATTPTVTTPAVTTPTATTPATTTPATSGPKDGGVLRMIVTEPPTVSMGVPENMRGSGGMLKLWVLEPLLYQWLDGTVEPWLAESYEWSDDHLTLTLHLREGVKFHDGTPFNAQAVKWNWDKRTAKSASGTAEVASTEIVDDYTFVFHLKKFNNSWIDNLTCTGISTTSLMISPTAYEENGEDWANWHPVGTGPFKFIKYDENQTLEVERNGDYWGERPHFDGIRWTFISDYVTALIAFQAEEGDTINVTGHARDLALELLSKPEKGYWHLESSGHFYVLMPSGAKPDSPFYKLQVREAMEYAVDKEKIVQGVYQGWAHPMSQTAMTFQLPYDPNFKGREYNPEKAKQLLAEAGYPSGFQTTIWCQVQLYGKDIDAIQAYLKYVGIDAKIEIISVGRWIDLESNGFEDGIEIYPIGTESYRGQVDRNWERPLAPGTWPKGPLPGTMYRPDELEELVQKYYTISDIAEEKAVGKQIVQLIYNEAICAPLYEQINVMVLQPWVKCTDTESLYYTGGIFSRPINRFWLDK